MSSRTPVLLLPACATLLFAGTLVAQTPQPPLQSRPPADQRLVFDVVAHKRSGAPAELPGASSLRVRIDGKPVTASDLTVARKPPQVMFVLDAINTPRADLVRSQGALLAWLHSTGERLPYETTVLIVTDVQPEFKGEPPGSIATGELIRNELYVARLSPSRNPAELATKLNAYTPGLARLGEASQALSATERVHISLQALSFFAAAVKDAPAPRLMLWISPGWPSVHITQAGYASQVFDSILYFDDALRSARVLLYALDPTGAATDHPAPSGDALLSLRPGTGQSGGPMRLPSATPGSEYYRSFLEPVRSPRNAEPNDMLLPVLALHSGGTVQTAGNDLLVGIQRFAADADALLEVTSPAPKPTGKVLFHTLQMEAPGAGDALRTRTGFYTR